MRTKTTAQAPRGRRRRAGFTLVELLVVMAVIGLLAGILLPSFWQVKVVARSTRTSVLLNKTLDTALEMFYDEKEPIGGDYPPSYWDATGTPGGNPYDAPGQDATNRTGAITAYGAQTLLWGLAGADFLGTPGFGQRLNELYKLDTSTKRPVYERREPYIDISKLNARNPTLRNEPGSRASAEIPVIMDDFGNAILYYKADTRKQGWDRYDYNHNVPFLFRASTPLNRLTQDWIADRSPKDFGANAEFKNATGFDGFIHNPRVTVGGSQPHNIDRFLLISAGPDTLYGTRDDVANFPVDGLNIPTGW